MTRLTSKSIYTVKIQNHPCTIIPPKSEIMRRGGYKCRTLEMNLQLRDQLKTTSYTYRFLYQNFGITANKNLQLIHKQGISGEEIYLIVNKCIIHHEGGHLTSFLECWSLLKTDFDFLEINQKEFMIIIINATVQLNNTVLQLYY